MESIIQDLRYGIRILVKSPAFTIVAILSLALGIGTNTTIFTLINSIFLQPLPVESPSQLMSVFTVDQRNNRKNLAFRQLTEGNSEFFLQVSYPNFIDYRDHNEVFSSLTAYAGANLNLSGQ